MGGGGRGGGGGAGVGFLGGGGGGGRGGWVGGWGGVPHERLDDVVGDGLDFAPGQWRRMRVVRRVVAEVLALEAIAVRVLIGIFVEVRHFGARPAAGDHLDQLVAVENGFMQVGGTSGRAWVAAPVAVGAVAELAVRLVVEQPVAEGDILGGRGGTNAEPGYHDDGNEFVRAHQTYS